MKLLVPGDLLQVFFLSTRGSQRPELEILAVGPSAQGDVAYPLRLSMRPLDDPLVSWLSALT